MLFRGEHLDSPDKGRGFVYRSHPIEASRDRPITLFVDQLQFHNWTCEWISESGDSHEILDSNQSVNLTSSVSLRAILYYTGSLTLSNTELEHCRPRLLVVAAQGIRRRADRFNVAIILVDAMRPDHLPGEKVPFIISPHLDNMRCLGTDFVNWHGTSSSSRPSIGSIFTGLYPRAHGAIRHTTSAASLFTGVSTLAEKFRAAGFQTAGFHSNAQIAASYGFDRGFDAYKGPIWDPDVTKESLRWLESVRPPFFLYVHYIRLHSPYRDTEFFDELYKGRTGDAEHDQYCANITLVDQSVGEFLLGLAERKLLGTTLLWFLSDHGEEFLEHGGRYHGRTLYEESIRTLSLLVYPPWVPRNYSISVLTSHVDVFPTLLSFSDMKAHTPIQGRDLSALVTGESGDCLERRIFAQAYGGADSDPLVSIEDAIISERYKLILPSWTQDPEFYDLLNDPRETRNIFSPERREIEGLLQETYRFREASDTIAEQSGRAEALQTEPVVLSPEELDNLRSLGYIR
ncbi:MAG: sulfatase [bacterium]